jgi:hypothetical protein
MAPWRELAAAAAAGLETLAVLAAIRSAGPLALMLHLASCGGAALGLHRRLAEGPAGWSLALSIALFVPVLGGLGLAAIGLFAPPCASPPEPALVRIPVPGADEATARAERAPAVDAGSPRRDRESRLAAVVAARGRSDPGSVALLRRALEDPDEDVRLLAHALLEAKSRAAYRRIHDGTRELGAAPEARRWALHRRLAEEYWDLAWLGLARGECLDHALGMARQHARAALADDPARASLHFLLGRIELRRRNAEGAEAALGRAAELGVPAARVRPYLAEAAFLARRFERVHRLAEAQPASIAPAAERIRRYWS